jgi:hypothetical protein
MGLLGKLFGADKPQHPSLDPASRGAARIEQNRTVLEAFAKKIHDKLELVPGEQAVYVFIGHPPDRFGIAWFAGTEEHNLKRLMADKKLSQQRINLLSEELRAAYQRASGELRYGYTLAGKQVVVTPSSSLEAELVKIIHEVEEKGVRPG